MPRTKEANEFIKQQRKAYILDVALKLFCLEGYDNVTMDNIAKTAKVSHGLIYHYFKDKTQILEELIELGKNKIDEAFINKPIEKKEGKGFYEDFTEFTLECLKKGEKYAYYLYLFLNFKINVIDYQKYSYLQFYQKFEEEFKKAQLNNDFEEGEVKDYLTCYFSLITSLVHSRLVHKNEFILPKKEIIMNLFYKKEVKN